MKKKNIIISLIVFLLILLTLVFTDDYRDFLLPEKFVQPIRDTSAVKQITITGEDTVRLSRINDHWVVNDVYLVEPIAIGNLLYALSNIEVTGKTRRDINQEDLRRIQIKEGRKSREWLLSTGRNGTLLFRPDDDEYNIVEVKAAREAELENIAAISESYWRDRELVSLYPDEIRRIEVHARKDWGEGFIFKREGGNFKLFSLEGRPVPDSLLAGEKMLMYSSYFQDIYYESVLQDKSKTRQILSSGPEYKIIVEDNGGREYKMEIYPRYKDNKRDIFHAYVRFNDADELVVVPYIVLDLLMQTFGHFIT